MDRLRVLRLTLPIDNGDNPQRLRYRTAIPEDGFIEIKIEPYFPQFKSPFRTDIQLKDLS